VVLLFLALPASCISPPSLEQNKDQGTRGDVDVVPPGDAVIGDFIPEILDIPADGPGPPDGGADLPDGGADLPDGDGGVEVTPDLLEVVDSLETMDVLETVDAAPAPLPVPDPVLGSGSGWSEGNGMKLYSVVGRAGVWGQTSSGGKYTLTSMTLVGGK